ncbi:chalcone isomerase family protein [Ottowia thiooxydans]|uniref:chalcone isomerase family protein n=1 Tax=Ottowia thiooxydans TaxID=219182 RepID=UPI00040F2BE7|nr:chalcone isomerase family protein [Ottowia thiooxydans]
MGNLAKRNMCSRRTAIGAVALAMACAAPVQAAQTPPPSTSFPTTALVENTALVLNGVGTRFRVVFKVYDMALYLPRKVSTTDEVLALAGPKKIDLAILREVSSTDLGLAMVKGMRANTTKDQSVRHLPAMTRLIEIFSSRDKLMPGDRVSMNFVPGKGSFFYVGNVQQGAPLGDTEFFGIVLKIWLGNSPADALLKDALLGA